MKSGGIVRRIDELGRIVVPKEICRTLYISANDPLEFTVEGENIILSKYRPVCAICGSKGELREFKSKQICLECLDEIRNSFE